jgi:hypothetical protein
MKQSATLNLVFINVLAASILACSTKPETENKQCVDENNNVVNEANCNQGSPSYNPHHRWYYGGGLFNHGSHVSGGGFIPLAGRSYSPPSQKSTSSHSSLWGGSSGATKSPSVSRGGFGNSGIGSGGG